MDSVLDDLIRLARRCERAAKPFGIDPIRSITDRLMQAGHTIGRAWCGSYLGYHATVYTRNLRPAGPDDMFDTEWGFTGAFSNRTTDSWAILEYEDIEAAILREAGVGDLSVLTDAANSCGTVFDQCRGELLPLLDALIDSYGGQTLKELRKRVDELKSHLYSSDLAKAQLPRGQFITRDRQAMNQDLRAPHHLCFVSWVIENTSYSTQTEELAKIARHTSGYIQQKLRMKGATVARTEGKIYIGHGRSRAWEDLRNLIRDRLQMDWEEFNRDSPAGLTAKERLEEMLDKSCFAFLVMTAEDEHADGSRHARENVIHEAGLFQGRMGFRRAIILLEEGCSEFSNVHGLQQIRFPKDKVLAKSEEIRQVLEREGIVK